MSRLIPIFLSVFCCLIPFLSSAQNTLEGVVVDKNNESLAFVNVTINKNDTKGVIADLDGRFSIAEKEKIGYLTFSYVGYETLVYQVSDQDINLGNIKIVLKESDFGLNEVVVKAGENPAHRIINKALANRKNNNHETLSSYQCEIYSKMQMGFLLTDSVKYEVALEELKNKPVKKNKKKKKEKSEEINERRLGIFDMHLFLSEIVTERKFKYPETVKNKLLHNRVSGMKTLDFSIMNAFQQFTFYDDFIFFAEEAFINPVSNGSAQLYFFNIEDTLYQSVDTIFVVSYKPRKGKIFEGLKGLLYINTNGYAIQNVLAEPADADKLSWKLEHKYIFENNDRWFPEQLNFEIIMPDPNSDFSKMKIIQKSYISKIQLNPELGFKEMKDDFVALKGDVISREDRIWDKYRKDSLSQKDERTYTVLDSLGDKNNLDAIMNTALSFASGNLTLKGIDFKWNDFLRLNNFESVRLGLGLQTNKNFSRHISLGAYVGYGFRDKAIKYGGNVVWDIIPDDILELKYAYSNDILEPGLFSFTLQDDVFIGRNLYAEIMDNEIKHSLSLQSRYKFLRTNISFEQSERRALYPYLYSGDNTDFGPYDNYTELSLNIRYAFGENNDWFMGTRLPSITRFPIVYFSYTQGLKGILNGQYDYQKISAAIEQRFNTRFLGETRYRIEGGWINNDVPYSKLFISSGTGGSYSFVSLDNAFQTMNNYEFVSDKFVNLFLQHDFGNILIRKKYSRPRLLLLHNMGYGTFDNPEDHYLVETRSMEKGYFESGLGLENIIIVPLRGALKLGLGARTYYRYGAYQNETLRDNIAVRWNVNIVF